MQHFTFHPVLSNVPPFLYSNTQLIERHIFSSVELLTRNSLISRTMQLESNIELITLMNVDFGSKFMCQNWMKPEKNYRMKNCYIRIHVIGDSTMWNRRHLVNVWPNIPKPMNPVKRINFWDLVTNDYYWLFFYRLSLFQKFIKVIQNQHAERFLWKLNTNTSCR